MSLPHPTGGEIGLASDDTLVGASETTRPQGPGPELRRGASIGRYIVLERLGAGSMGVVYAAYDPDLDRKVAIKVLRRSHGGDPERIARGQARLLREAQALAKLSHRNVTAIHDLGTHDGEVFLAMEYIDGETLDRWAARVRPDWRRILVVLGQAGAGLAAAHAAGFLHRDFKPSNVMVTTSGEARVTDFGLARALDDSLPSTAGDDLEHSRGEALQADLTGTGALLGTLGYMSPEQMAGATLDQRSDQFGFCVTAWEALFGRRPFAGTTLGEQGFNVSRGAIEAPPPEFAVDARIRRALTRGLAAQTSARHPDMNVLLALLTAPRDRRRTSAIVGAGASVITAAALLLWMQRPDLRCTGAEAWLGAVWDEARRTTIDSAKPRGGNPHAAELRAKATEHLDAYAAAIVDAHAEACRTSVVLQQESSVRHEHRVACLDERRAALDEVAGLLEAATDEQLPRLVGAAAALPRIAACVGTEVLDDGPDDPALATEVAKGRAMLAAARVHADAADYDTARARITEAIAAAGAAAWPRLRAEAMVLQGALSVRTGDFSAARTLLEDAFELALRHGDDRVAALAGAYLVTVVGVRQGDAEGGQRWGRHALALAQHRREGGLEEASVRTQLAGLAQTTDDLRTAEREIRVALGIRETLLDPDDPDLGNALNTLAIVQASGAEFDAARDTFERALAVREAAFGPHNPEVAGTLVNLGTVLLELNRPDEAQQLLDRALAIDEALLGPQHPDLIPLYATRARVHGAAGRRAQAAADMRRALELAETVYGPAHPRVLSLLLNAAQTSRNAGDTADARAFAARAESIAAQGASGSELAATMHALAALASDDGRIGDAADLYARAVAAFDASFGPEHPDTSAPLLGLGEMRLRLGDAAAAVPPLERAVALARDETRRAPASFALARALWASGGDRDRARTLAEAAALASTEAERAPIEAWLRDGAAGPTSPRP